MNLAFFFFPLPTLIDVSVLILISSPVATIRTLMGTCSLAAGPHLAAHCEKQAKFSKGTVSTYRNELGGSLDFGDNQRWVDGQTVNVSSPKRQAFLPCVFLFLAGPLSSASAS